VHSVPTQTFPATVVLSFAQRVELLPLLSTPKTVFRVIKHLDCCAGLTLVGPRCPPSHSYHFPYSKRQGEKNTAKSPWVKIRTERSRKINLMCCQLSRVGQREIKPNLKASALLPSLLPGLNFIPTLLPPPSPSSTGRRGMGVLVSS